MDINIFTEPILHEFRDTVIAPSNPFTIDNPDIMVFNGHQLLGLYIPRKKEIDNTDLLLRRLFLSRLSLYSEMKCILMLRGDGRKLDNKGKVIGSFDAAYIFEGERDLLRFVKQEFPQRIFISAKDKRFRLKRFWGCLDYLKTHGLISKGYQYLEVNNSFHLESWSRPGKVIRPRSILFRYPYIVSSKDANKNSFKANYESLMTYTMMYDYFLSDGGRLSPNNTEKDIFKFLNMENLDPIVSNEISLRTLLFLGFVPGRVDNPEAISAVRDSYFAFMKDNNYL